MQPKSNRTLSRWTRIAMSLGIAASAAACSSEGENLGTDDSEVSSDTGRNANGYTAQESVFQKVMVDGYVGSKSDLAFNMPREKDRVGDWIFVQGIDTALDVAEVTGRYEGTVRTLIRGQDSRGWKKEFYDDENWMILALVRAYNLYGEGEWLRIAEDLHADIRAAEDTTCCGDQKGGIWWDRPHTQKATAINAGAALSAVRLYRVTKKTSYLDFAKKQYGFWRGLALDLKTGALMDHIKPSGERINWRFTYNEALMIAAATELYKETKQASYESDARLLASAMLKDETRDSKVGKVLFDGTNEKCNGDCPMFKGIASRFLRLYADTFRDKEASQVLGNGARAVREVAFDPSSKLVGTDWSVEFRSGATMTEAMLSAEMALFAVAPLQTKRATKTFEAEEAFLGDGIGLEASSGKFSGWGYLAGWEGGEGVTFRVDRPRAGDVDLVFRYAGVESRKYIFPTSGPIRDLVINGSRVKEDLEFPKTGSWDNFQDVKVRVKLPAGRSTIALTRGKYFLNLDKMEIVD